MSSSRTLLTMDGMPIARRSIVIVAWLLLPTLSRAHTEGAGFSGFASGFLHPLSGMDHLAAMVAVGLWGAILGRPAVWMLPIVFPLVMTFGAIAGILEIPIPAVEAGVALSAVALGTFVALAWKMPNKAAAVFVGFFAIFHGYAHGAELPESADALLYTMGFVTATGSLHLAGIGLSLLHQFQHGLLVVRAVGALIALIGLGHLFNLF